MQSSGDHSPMLTGQMPQCHVCGAAANAQTMVDLYGAAVCAACLRRIDADPREKRQIMLAMGEAAYW